MSLPSSTAFATLAIGALAVLTAPASAGEPLSTPYDPPWADIVPTEVIALDFDPMLSGSANASVLAATIAGLVPGDRLEVGTGVWNFNQIFNVNVAGTPQAPIWIVAQDGATPVITRSDANQNVMNVGVPSQGGATEYACIRGFELTGGSVGVRFYSCRNVWFDGNYIHDTAQAGFTANVLDNDSLFLTRNEIAYTNGTGEGMYLGGNNSSVIVSNSVIALNHVHHCGGSQGDGIELKQGSWGNWIAENVVHNTNYPCLLVYGTDGNERNLIERNTLYQSNDNVLQVQGEAIVQNNLVAGGGGAAFHSHDHQGQVSDLWLTNNTFLNVGVAGNMVDWDSRPNMRLFNNVFYSKVGKSIRYQNGAAGLIAKGNAVFGPLQGAGTPAADAYFAGNGASDFIDVDYLGFERDAQPRPLGPLKGAAVPPVKVSNDLFGAARDLPADVGALAVSSYAPHYGTGLEGSTGEAPRITANARPILGDTGFRLLVSEAPPVTLAFLVVGVVATEQPFLGGTLWTLPLLTFFTATNANGIGAKALPLPPDPSLEGVALFAQWSVIDVGNPLGVALSDALELVLRTP